MTQEITDQTWIVALKGGTILPISEKQKDIIHYQLENTSHGVFNINGRIVVREAILYLIPATDYEETLRLKRGEWKCEKGHWNSRGLTSCQSIPGDKNPHCWI